MACMDQQQTAALARELIGGDISIDQFVSRISTPSTGHLEQARVDLDRARRCGVPEVIYGEGKTLDALQEITATLQKHGQGVLLTRLSSENAEALVACFSDCHHNPVARTLRVGTTCDPAATDWASLGRVCVVSAGTSDLPIAEEARETAAWMGVAVETIYDVGVAGPQRLLEELDVLGARRQLACGRCGDVETDLDR